MSHLALEGMASFKDKPRWAGGPCGHLFRGRNNYGVYPLVNVYRGYIGLYRDTMRISRDV